MAHDSDQVNRFRRSAKVSEAQLLQIIYGFGAGVSVKAIATSSGVTERTVRTEYIAIRKLLLGDRFARWHGLRRTLPSVADHELEALVKTAFLDELAVCFFKTTCYRNFALGNRKERLCKSCPLPSKFRAQATALEAVEMLDEVRALYTRLGIRAQNRGDTLKTLREMIAHAATVSTIRSVSKRLSTGLPSPADTNDLAMGDFLFRVMDELHTSR